MMKRLFLVLGILTVAGLSFAGGQTTFNYNFPTFYGVVTNVSSVYFFGDDGSPTVGAAKQNGLPVATLADLETCIENAVANLSGGSPADIMIGTASDNLSLNCAFAPSDVNTGNPTVSGYTNAASKPTDGEVIVITNDTDGWQVKGDVTGTPPTFGNVLAAPAYVKSDNTLAYKGTTRWVILDTLSNTQAFTDADAYSTNYYFVYAIPLVFKMDITQLAAPTNGSFTVTWDAANL